MSLIGLRLSHPEVAFRLIHNERKLLQTNGNGDVRQVLASIYGMAIAKKLDSDSTANRLITKLMDMLSMPEVTRASRNYISTMINGRFIKNYRISKSNPGRVSYVTCRLAGFRLFFLILKWTQYSLTSMFIHRKWKFA